jgi:enterochelin esterase-like enzyme
MKYQQAGMIGVTLSLALTGLACRQVVNISAAQSDVSPSSNSQPTHTPAPQSNVLPSIDLQPTETPSVVPGTPLSYKIETYDSKTMGGKRTYGVALPPDYDLNLTQRYPVIFLLHGGHGSPTSWFNKKQGDALETLQRLYGAGKLPPSIIITPDGNDRRGSSPYWDPQYIDGPNGKVVTAVGDELVKVIQDRYRTLPTPDYWAIGGLSSGAWGATNVGLHNLNHFSIVFSHSGYFRDKSGPQNSPINFVKKLSSQQRRQLRIYLDTGKEDTSSLKENRRFHTVLNQLGIENVLREFSGEHTWQYWREHLADSLTFVGKQFQLTAQGKPPENPSLSGANRPNQ